MKARYKLEIERLYLQLYPLLFEYARSSLSSDSLAEEAVQDTFRIACQKPEAMINSPNPEGWIMNTLKNVTILAKLKKCRKIMTKCIIARNCCQTILRQLTHNLKKYIIAIDI